MDAETFRLVDKRHDITSILTEAGATIGGDLWQVTADSKRIIYNITNIQIDFAEEKIFFHASEKILFDPKHTVFVRINHKSLVFKLVPGEFKVSQDKITSRFPKLGRALEFRSEPRFTIPLKVHLVVVMRPAIANTLARIDASIVDISTKGIGISVKERYKSLVFKESSFTILTIAGIDLDQPLGCKVVNMPGRVQGIRKGEFKVGIKLAGIMPEDIFKHVRLSSR